MDFSHRRIDRLTLPDADSATMSVATDQSDRLTTGIEKASEWLLAQQNGDGHWCAELEGDSILESEFFLLLTYLGQQQTDLGRRLANELRFRQADHGGWAIYPNGPVDVSASVKAYFALKIAGDSPDAPHMRRAVTAIRDAGGAERVNSFTRYYLALLGAIAYQQCPAVPPELVLVPSWCPFNLYEMSAWSRTIVVPLSLLWAFQPVRELAPEFHIRELFLRSPEELPTCMPPDLVDERGGRDFWKSFFGRVDSTYKFCDRLRFRPLRAWAVRRAERWLLERFEDSDGLGAIFPPIIWSIVGLKCLGYKDDSPEVSSQFHELERLCITEDDRTRLEPCRSPVWDTAIASLGLREAGIEPTAEPLRTASKWLLDREVRRFGDWAMRSEAVEPGGWCFEYRNAFYPDVDDTAMVLMALLRSLPIDSDAEWTAELLLDTTQPDEIADRLIVSAQDVQPQEAARNIDAVVPRLAAMKRGLRWLLAMQSKDGGWGAFDRDNVRHLFTKVPFADHNAMIDPSTADLTGRLLEMFGMFGVPKEHPAVRRAIRFVLDQQEPDGSWFGRWGVNYIYGTWQALVGLHAIGFQPDHPAMRRGAQWLIDYQQADGGWGESVASYSDKEWRGRGVTTASQTAWALMGLMAAGQSDSIAVRDGINYLVETQNAEGVWDEAEFTGTGFPKVFYLKYHYYRAYFPLMALGRYRRLTRQEEFKPTC
ncbi:terpene cyclase/mutase family protein [Stratiformator vulcanicus]|uniref:Squalene--hopene cyclase n=1 Tax=Stratiformator vulcanicus TaxID=2527980 RepID=A0A517R2A7_9PLAN|nr:terpene cyclase/mutase family protein [Stratiformator vulcanicus]QDT37991.1 Squalene--hopene cyclase [Stratiformator vulcanicus]